MAGFYVTQLLVYASICILILVLERWWSSKKSAIAFKEHTALLLEDGQLPPANAVRAAALRTLMRKYLSIYAIIMGKCTLNARW